RDRVDEQRPFVQRQKRVGMPEADEPGEGQPEQSEVAEHEAEQAEAAEHVLRPLAEAGEEFHRQEVEKPLDEAADAVLGPAETARAMVDDQLADAEAAGRREYRDEAVQLPIEFHLA